MTVREQAEALARRTQVAVCQAVERLEGSAVAFRADAWRRPGGGGGESRVLRGGDVFDSAGVNCSVVHGELPEEMAAIARGTPGEAEPGVRFWATGVSVVLHPRNPMVPIAHANYRYFELSRPGTDAPFASWFGGGSDLTPSYLFEADARHFHGVHKAACDRHDAGDYPRFKAWCDHYFLLPHRGERRGVGGIFFDRLDAAEPRDVLPFVRSAAGAFVDAYLPIVERRRGLAYGDRECAWQHLRRGRYVEFNLLHDRGTHFGLRTGGRTESVLMSLPPSAHWGYEDEPEPGSAEAELVEVLRSPREWT